MANMQVHRFGDLVGCHVGDGQTQYLTPSEAAKLARALNKAARSCKAEDFTTSTCGTFTLEFNGSRFQDSSFKRSR